MCTDIPTMLWEHHGDIKNNCWIIQQSYGGIKLAMAISWVCNGIGNQYDLHVYKKNREEAAPKKSDTPIEFWMEFSCSLFPARTVKPLVSKCWWIQIQYNYYCSTFNPYKLLYWDNSEIINPFYVVYIWWFWYHVTGCFSPENDFPCRFHI